MKEAESPADDKPEAERVVCTVCLHSNSSRADYCSKCGAPINTLLTFAPYDQVLLEGFAYRRAVDGPPSKIILIGMWLLFGPALVWAPFVIASGYQSNATWGLLGLVAEDVFSLIYFLLSAIILYRTTSNYRSKRQNHVPTRRHMA